MYLTVGVAKRGNSVNQNRGLVNSLDDMGGSFFVNSSLYQDNGKYLCRAFLDNVGDSVHEAELFAILDGIAMAKSRIEKLTSEKGGVFTWPIIKPRHLLVYCSEFAMRCINGKSEIENQNMGDLVAKISAIIDCGVFSNVSFANTSIEKDRESYHLAVGGANTRQMGQKEKERYFEMVRSLQDFVDEAEEAYPNSTSERYLASFPITVVPVLNSDDEIPKTTEEYEAEME